MRRVQNPFLAADSLIHLVVLIPFIVLAENRFINGGLLRVNALDFSTKARKWLRTRLETDAYTYLTQQKRKAFAEMKKLEEKRSLGEPEEARRRREELMQSYASMVDAYDAKQTRVPELIDAALLSDNPKKRLKELLDSPV